MARFYCSVHINVLSNTVKVMNTGSSSHAPFVAHISFPGSTSTNELSPGQEITLGGQIFSIMIFDKTNNIFIGGAINMWEGNQRILFRLNSKQDGTFETSRIALNERLSMSIDGYDSFSPSGLSTLHIDDTRLEQINYGSKSYTTFPVDIPLDPNIKTMTVIGKTFNVQLDNELNIVRVKDGQTEYRQFPATIMIGENKTLP